MAVHFPNFYGGLHEDVRGFLDNLEMAHLISDRDTNEVKLRAFPLVLKGEARTWYHNLPDETKGDWDILTQTFATRFGRGDTPEGVWRLLLSLNQAALLDFP